MLDLLLKTSGGVEILSLSSNDLTEISLEALADALTGGCLLGAQAVQLMGKMGADLFDKAMLEAE